jgi:hypothetical protein
MQRWLHPLRGQLAAIDFRRVAQRAKGTPALTVIGIVVVAAAIFLFVTAIGHLHPDYGDVPTWLAVAAATGAGWIALRQLQASRMRFAGRRSFLNASRPTART